MMSAVAGTGSESHLHSRPFELRDQNLFNLIHGQPLPTDAQLEDSGQAHWSSSLIITNTLNIENRTSEDIYLDYELYRFNLSYQYGLNDDWNLKLDVPLLYQNGGIFDAAIDNWHQLLGLPRANRPFVDHNKYEVRYLSSRSRLDIDSSTTLGDIQFALAYDALRQRHTQLSLWAAIKLATGDETHLSGSGATDTSVWLALNQILGKDWVINSNAGIVVPGKSDFQGIALSDQVFFGHIMLGWSLNEALVLKAQLQGHTSYYDTSELKILSDTYFISLGGSYRVTLCDELTFALSEDLKVDASPDASLLISWHHHSSSHCQ